MHSPPSPSPPGPPPPHPPPPDLLGAVKTLKPSVLLGITSSDSGEVPWAFDAAVCGAMAAHARHPVILPLTPTTPECSAADALTWTQVGGHVCN